MEGGKEKNAVKLDRIICDNGSGYCKLGYGGDSFPRHVFPSIVGRPMLRASQQIGDIELKPIMVGDEAAAVRGMLEMSYPLIEGTVKNWEEMEEIWDYCFFTKLGLKPEDLKDKYILLTEAANNANANRNKMGEIMFEKYGFAGVMFEYQALLTLMAEGNQTGLVLDAGDGVSHCIPVYEGHIQTNNIKALKVAGRHVTEYLIKLLLLRGYAFNSSADFETVREIKEKLCYMSVSLEKERKLAQDTTVLDREYTLPDGRVINVGRERFEAPECLMQPENLGEDYSESPGLAQMVCESIWGCELDIQKPLAANIWLSGGTTMIPGLSTRMENEIKDRWVQKKGKGDASILNRVKIAVHDPPRRKNAVFMGASFLASFAQEDRYVQKREYEEAGNMQADLFKKVY